MQTIEIKSDVMDILCQKAEITGRTISEIVDDLLRAMLASSESDHVVKMKCHSCKQEIEYQINDTEGYCDNCESVVFIEKYKN